MDVKKTTGMSHHVSDIYCFFTITSIKTSFVDHILLYRIKTERAKTFLFFVSIIPFFLTTKTAVGGRLKKVSLKKNSHKSFLCAYMTHFNLNPTTKTVENNFKQGTRENNHSTVLNCFKISILLFLFTSFLTLT